MANGQTFTLNFDAKLNVSQMKGAIGNIQSELNRLQLPNNLTKGITGTLSNLEKELRNFEVASGKDLSQKNNFSALERSAEKIQSLFKDLQIQARDLGHINLDKFFPASIVSNIERGKKALQDYTTTMEKLEKAQLSAQQKLNTALNKQTISKENLDQAKQQYAELAKAREEAYKALYDKVGMKPENLFDEKSITEAVQKIQELQNRLKEIQNDIGPSGKKYNYSESYKLGKTNELKEIEDLLNRIQQISAAMPEAARGIKPLETTYSNATNKVKELQLALEQAEKATNQGQADAIKKVFDELNAAGIDTSGFQNNLAGAQAALEKYAEAARGDATNALEQLRQALQNNSGPIDEFGNKMRTASDDFRAFNEQVRDVSALKSRIQYFFGINNAINLVKRGIRSAIETIKDLDKAMTETAVVTKNTVSDMWAKLPEYTKRANELGVSTLDAYKAATLYYQQGLNDEQAGVLSAETLKMARIAGLDAAEATDRMTNALRGFNMELNAVSAQKVDDVYSQLAAMSASNVDEISTAMTKVASLAHSANMEFETTAAFLAQIIETTRESAETAGTALKTVVARFSEVKKLYSEDQLKGTDEEGQGIDVNKISTALRTAGIDLNKYFLGEVGLDDIFMELASKWDSLTSVQQRYIATQAAGSRQQSRFIALMQDYARTQELVGAAYDANGASARQFEKTQESLQSKLARLKNAWNEFLMGLANNGIVKGVVDVLTTLLNIVNKLTSAFGTGAGFVLKWATALSAFGAIKNVFRTGGFLDLALMGGLQAGGKGALANAAVRTGLLSGLVRGGGTASILSGQAAEIAGKNAQAVNGKSGSIILGGLGGFAKKGWRGAQGVGNLLYGIGGRTGFKELTAGGTISGISGMGAGLTGIGTALLGVAAAVAAVYAGYQAWLNLTPQGQLKNAQKYADTMSDVAENTSKQVTELKKARQTIKEYDQAIVDSTSVSERGEAITARNDYIQSLLDQDSRYAEYLSTTFENGQMVLKLDIDASALDNAIKGATMAQAGSDFAQATVAGLQANILRSKLSDVDLTSRQIAYGQDEHGATLMRQMTDDEIARYTKYQSQLSQYESQLGAYAQKGFGELISSDKVSDEVATLMSKGLAKGFDEMNLPTGSGWWGTRSHWQNEYLKAYGTEASSEMKTADIYRAVRQYELTEGRATQVEKLTGLLTGSSKEAYQALLEGLTEGGKLSTQNLLGLNAESETSIYELLGFDVNDAETLGKELKELADALGMTTDEVREGIKKRAQAEKKAQQQNAFNTSASMYQNGIQAQTIGRYLTLGNVEDQRLIQSLYESFDSSFLSDSLIDSLITGLKDGGSEVTDWLKTIDLSNPIQAFNKLSDAAINGTDAIKGTAQALLDAGNSSKQFSASAQLGYFATSSSFEAISEQLDKFIEENGKITADNVLDLAEANSDLNGLLENNIVSATGLANILTELQQGTINVWDLSDAVIAAAAAMDDLDGIAAKTIADLNGFDPGYDENDVTKFINTVLENANQNIGKGALGNNQMRNYMEYIFGSFDKEYAKMVEGTDYTTAYENWLSQNTAWLEANKENMYSAWQDIAPSLQEQFGKIGEVYDDGTQIILKAGGRTTQQLIDAMVATGKVTEQQARMMITDFKNYSADFAHEMQEADLPNAVQAWMDSISATTGGLYDKSELDTLATLLGVDADRIAAEVDKIKASSDKYKNINFKGISFTDNNKESATYGQRTQESITSAWQDIGIEHQEKIDWTLSKGEGVKVFSDLFDYDEIKSQYQNLGIPQLFEQDFNTVLQEGDSFYAKLFGSDEPQRISISQGQTAGEAYAEAYQKAVNDDLASSLADSLKSLFEEDGIEINVTVSEDGIGQIELLKTTEDEAEQSRTQIDGQSINVSAPTGQVDALASALDGVIGKIRAAQAAAAEGIDVQTGGGGHAAGGYVQSHASGSNNISPGIALTGEEGAEIVWNKDKGYAYITGEHHPEFQNLRPGDRIFNAQETRKILGSHAAGGLIPSFARGYGAATAAAKKSDGGSSGGGSGKGEKDKTPEEWKNDLDWLYNLMEDIAELERDQKAIEEEYEDFLKNQNKTGGDLYRLLVKQLGNLYTQLNHQTFALEKREQEMREFMDITNDKDEYLWYNWQDRTIEIDWDAIDQITDEEEYKHVKELIDEAEEIQDKMDDADDAIMDITNQIQELENIWRDTFTDFEDRVLDAIIKSYQKVIDNYSELNDTLNNSNQQILDSLQKQISLQRQIRDNTKTEEEITDDEARLAYLRRDTTGGNELAAMQLEKELADQRQSYEDSLVDQAISRLQEDNEEAQQQRERQIEIMQAQLDYQAENGMFNAYVQELLTTAMGADGELLTNSDLVTLLKDQENWNAMSDVSKQVWDEELNGTFKEVAAFLLKQNAEENGTFITALTAAVDTVGAAIGSYSQAVTKLGSQIQSMASSAGSYGGSGGSGGSSSPDTKPSQSTYVSSTSVSGGGYGYGSAAMPADLRLKMKGWASGGIVSHTGFGLLHGSAAEPEYVLNARQTDAFLKLADVLPSMMNTSGFASTNTFGGSTYNFSINLDSVSPDYDVDRMVSLVKEKLYDSGSYRNNNVLSFIR